MIKKLTIIILMFFTANIMLVAQDRTDSLSIITNSNEYAVKKFFSYLGEDFKTAITSPADFKTSEWLTVAGMGCSLVTLFYYDEKISTEIKSQNNTFANRITDLGNYCGEATVVAPLLASVWLTGYLTENQRMQKTFFYSLETLAVSAVFVQAIKYSTGRARPYLELGSDEFIGFNSKGDYNSFPSGHTQTAFAVASSFAMEYKDNLWIVIPAYTIAATTAYARVRDNKHWPSDVFMGALIGYLSAKTVRIAHHEKSNFSFGVTNDYAANPALAIYYNF